MTTFATVIADARVILNDQTFADSETHRYTDAELLVYARQAVIEVRRIRMDLFLSNMTAPFNVFLTTDSVPVPDDYIVPVVDFIVMRAEMRDDEFATDGRAMAFMQRFRAAMLGIT